MGACQPPPARSWEDELMAERRAARSNPQEVDSELEPLADELYGLRPEAFSAARDEAVRAARGQGKAALARELARLRKPTQSAWLVNVLWRDQREVMQQLFELANELSRAQAEAAGPTLRALTAQRRELETALTRQAVALAEKAGVKVSDSVMREAQDTLGAALARPEVADEVRAGRLVKPATYAGFGVLPPSTAAHRGAESVAEPIDLQAAQRARAADQQRAGQASGAAEDRQAVEERRAAEERRATEERRAAAQRRLEAVRAAAET